MPTLRRTGRTVAREPLRRRKSRCRETASSFASHSFLPLRRLVAALAVLTAGAASAEQRARHAERRRQHVRRAARAARGSARVKSRSESRSTTARSARAPASRRSRTGTVDFGASDAPLTPTSSAACTGCVQIPWALAAPRSSTTSTASATTTCKLTGTVLAKIYLGKITNWNDPAIKKLNKGVNLPDKTITVVHRSDGSGTTYNFTDYLSHVSPRRGRRQVGTGTARQLADRHRRARTAPASPASSDRRPARSATSTSSTRSRTT